MKLQLKSKMFISPVLGLAAALVLEFSPSVCAARELFSDNFQSGDLAAKWQTGEESGTIKWMIVPDPDVADANQKVLCTPEMGTQLYIYHIEPMTAEGSGLLLSFRFNADATNNEWNTIWTLLTDPILNGGYLVNGYSMRLGFTGHLNDKSPTVAITRIDPVEGNGDRVVLATQTLPLAAFHPGWNEVKFHWKMDGTLTVFLNGKEVVSAKDTKYQPAFRTLSNITWLSNNMTPPESLPEGRKLYFDNVKVEEVDL